MTKFVLGFLLLVVAGYSTAADAGMRRFITKGMEEGEVIIKIGKPDNESVTSGGAAQTVEKIWTYFPNEHDRQMITRVTIKNGKVVAVERDISR